MVVTQELRVPSLSEIGILVAVGVEVAEAGFCTTALEALRVARDEVVPPNDEWSVPVAFKRRYLPASAAPAEVVTLWLVSCTKYAPVVPVAEKDEEAASSTKPFIAKLALAAPEVATLFTYSTVAREDVWVERRVSEVVGIATVKTHAPVITE